MRLSLLDVIRDLRGQSSRRFVELLGAHVDATLEGARLAERAARGETTWDAARAAMVDVEHRGDERRQALILEISRAIVTPIDREDLFRVSRSIDDVLDNLRDFVRECDLFRVANGSSMLPVLEAITESVVALRDAIAVIVEHPEQVERRAMAAHKAANRVRRSYDAALAGLFGGDLVMEVLKVREVLRRLDVVGLRVGEAADVLSDAAVKRSAGSDSGAPPARREVTEE